MKGRYSKQRVSYLLILISFIATPFANFLIHDLDLLIESKLFSLRITELTTVFILLFLILWYLNTSNLNRRVQVISVLIGTSISLILSYGFLSYWFFRNASEFTARGYQKVSEFSEQQDKYIPLVTSIFDKAEKTNVRQDIDKEYLAYLTNGVGRKPVYFIRLKDGQLQKLFQSGDIKYEVIDTDGEKTVQGMLLGKVNPIQYPQYTCCGGDDLSWNEESFFRLFVPERRYLKDFYSELETILLIKDKKGNILGALVELHGD